MKFPQVQVFVDNILNFIISSKGLKESALRCQNYLLKNSPKFFFIKMENRSSCVKSGADVDIVQTFIGVK